MIPPVITIFASLLYVAFRVIRILVITAIVIVLIAIGLFWWIGSGVFSTSKFDAQKWHMEPKSRQEEISCYRGGMAMDLRDYILKPGLTKEDVHTLLGKPDVATNIEEQYVLGMCSGLKWDYDYLHVFYGADGKLEKSDIYQH